LASRPRVGRYPITFGKSDGMPASGLALLGGAVMSSIAIAAERAAERDDVETVAWDDPAADADAVGAIQATAIVAPIVISAATRRGTRDVITWRSPRRRCGESPRRGSLDGTRSGVVLTGRVSKETYVILSYALRPR
jgi:hypothetical protein